MLRAADLHRCLVRIQAPRAQAPAPDAAGVDAGDVFCVEDAECRPVAAYDPELPAAPPGHAKPRDPRWPDFVRRFLELEVDAPLGIAVAQPREAVDDEAQPLDP